MALTVNGTIVPTTSTLTVNGTSVDSLTMNAVEVWRKLTPPSAITDFTASDNKVDTITMTWSPVERATSYDLYEGTNLIASDITSPYDYAVTAPHTGTFHVKAKNAAGETASNTDEGSAVSGTPDAPAAITDFTASDDAVNKITMTWSPAARATSYAIYEGSTLAASDVTSPYDYGVTGPHTGTYHVLAKNDGGATPSNTDSGTALEAAQPPSAVSLNLTAARGSLTASWTGGEGADTFILYRNGDPHASGDAGFKSYTMGCVNTSTYTFYVVAKNSIGDTQSASKAGNCTLPPQPPSKVTDLTATDGEIEQITVTWGSASGATSYDLYRDNTLLAANVSSPYTDSFVGISSPVSYTYFIRAKNADGTTDSNTDAGRAVERTSSGSVEVRYNSVKASGDGHGTITGSNGSFTFNPPANVRTLTIMVVGGGGSGACSGYVDPNYPDNYAEAGGGYIGDVATVTYTDVTSPITITVGKGGASVMGGYKKGNAGTASEIVYNGNTHTANGGAGGTYRHPDTGGSAGYRGDGSGNDGIKKAVSQHTAFGGRGLTASYGLMYLDSKGGNGEFNNSAQAGVDGSGGGGVTDSYGGGEQSGAGGDGIVWLAWA